MDREGIEEIVRTYERGVNEGDLELLLSLFADGAAFHDPIGLLEPFEDATEPGGEGYPPAFVGEEGLQEFFTRVVAHLPELDYEIENVFVNEDLPGAAFQWSGVAERDGRTLRMRAVDVFEMEDGEITAVHGYTARPDTFVWD